ncbi:peptidylprolyl isomerase [Nitrosomonas sp.]|uniref:peptidylprolyl isomerase n=1 Tax=Nitrosomonas sp. TaxID=42353 RepID=UPI00283E44DB|nr:peptidylprolyl isomerase [Nitrosomonas sp.]MDR4515525.1 peptidylprolyl isomerase [Nitrosomonas sp.]
MAFTRNFSTVITTLSFLLFSTVTQANPVACFNTNLGGFCMELLERQAPQTVANFIRYIDSGAYDQSIFHRSEPGFVIQGGGFKVSSGSNGVGVTQVDTFDPVVNEFGLSNVRSTVAMAKLSGDPDSATSQWFVNLDDNSGPPADLDTQNEGFTVFAKILYDGMTLFDAIAGLQRVNFGGALSSTPTVNFDVSQPVQVENFVLVNSVALHDVTAVFDENVLTFAVDTGNGNMYDVRLLLIAVEPDIIFELDPASVTPLTIGSANMATFSGQNRTLTIPSAIINKNTLLNNVVMSLSDPARMQFTLVSFE